MKDEKAGKPHLGNDHDGIEWDWWGESPVEIVLVAFILIFYFTLPRMGCGIAKTEASVDQQPGNSANAGKLERAGGE